MIICKSPVPTDDHLQEATTTTTVTGVTGQKEEKKGKEKEGKKFLWTDGHTGQSKVAQEVLADLKKCSGLTGHRLLRLLLPELLRR